MSQDTQGLSQDREPADGFSKGGFILSAIGSSVGLGNIWRFPYLTSENGGAAFFLLFTLCLLLIGLPILLAELSIGRGGRGNAASSFQRLSGRKAWGLFGLISVFGSVIIMSFYGVVTGWTLHYAVRSFSGVLSRETNYAESFQTFTASGYGPVFWQVMAMVIVCWVVARGISGGIEKFNKILMPMMVIALLVLLVNALTLSGARAGIEYFLKPDFSKLTPESALLALGHAFFSLSLGMGTMVTYGAYVNKRQSLKTASLAVVGGDLLYALVCGLIIFPTSFTYGLESQQGPGLVFIVLPAAFHAMPFGFLLGGIFFLLLAIAALTSAVSMLEVPVAFAMEKWKWTRTKASLATTAFCILLGVPAALSAEGPWKGYKWLGRTVFDWFDYSASNVLLPFGGLLVTLFAGYVWKQSAQEADLRPVWAKTWLLLLRYLAPIVIILIFLYSAGVLRF
ncbi:sodium-dependent transporter [Gorillibacterium sp. CAU 1737]|uniref:sodium-dependent transporter n=1 Tax=Gorillibacterium sp. CAU 1737 TaxID=3140362 RepID=UPI003260B97C